MNHEYEQPELDNYPALSRAIDNPLLQEFIEGEGPLTAKEVPLAIRSSELFQDTVAIFGWPDQREDGTIEPPAKFESDREFAQALWDHKRPDHVNNFRIWIKSDPGFPPDVGMRNGVDDLYRIKPALHRAHAIMPEFFHELREAYLSVLSEATRNHEAHKRHLKEFAKPENQSVVHGMRIAYAILGRLIKVGDRRIETGLLFGDAHGSDIVSAKTELYT